MWELLFWNILEPNATVSCHSKGLQSRARCFGCSERCPVPGTPHRDMDSQLYCVSEQTLLINTLFGGGLFWLFIVAPFFMIIMFMLE